MSAHQAEFQARLARIQAGKGFTKTTVYVGMDTAFTYLPQGRRKAGMAQVAGNMGLALGFPMAMAVGFLSFGLQRYAAFVLGDRPDPQANADVELLKMAAMAFGIAVVAGHLMRLRDRGLLVAKALGVLGGMLFFHNLVHLWPQLFERMFSPLWVAQLLAETQPHSLLWRGVCFPF